jgi:hypothetical protein
MESCQPIKRLKDKKKNGSGMLMDMGHPDWRSLVAPERLENWSVLGIRCKKY